MWTTITILFLFMLGQDDKLAFFNTKTEPLFSNISSCKTEIDSLTNKLIYIKADVLPSNQGGKAVLMKILKKEFLWKIFQLQENLTQIL
jgi:hypothetical protein